MTARPDYTTTRRRARIATADYVERYVDLPRVLGYCEQCPIYGQVWSCPPFEFDPLTIWTSYDWLEIDAVQIEFSTQERAVQRSPLEMQTIVRRAIDREKRMAARRHRHRARSHRQALVLSAGACELCDPCTRTQGEPCKHPDLMQYSIEALGGDVVATVEELCGFEVKWSEGIQLPQAVLVVTGLLSRDIEATVF